MYVCSCQCVHLAAAAAVSDCIHCYRPQLVCVAFAANLCVNKHESRCINAHTKANSAVPPALYSPSLLFLALLSSYLLPNSRPQHRHGFKYTQSADKRIRSQCLNINGNCNGCYCSTSSVKFMWHATNCRRTQTHCTHTDTHTRSSLFAIILVCVCFRRVLISAASTPATPQK